MAENMKNQPERVKNLWWRWMVRLYILATPLDNTFAIEQEYGRRKTTATKPGARIT